MNKDDSVPLFNLRGFSRPLPGGRTDAEAKSSLKFLRIARKHETADRVEMPVMDFAA
jgi:hypothetical protein